MADDATPPENAAPEAHVRLEHAVLCDACGRLILEPAKGQRFCSGACRAKASRTTRTDRLTRDLQELQRRIDEMLQKL